MAEAVRQTALREFRRRFEEAMLKAMVESAPKQMPGTHLEARESVQVR
jgi:hypothetical protein